MIKDFLILFFLLLSANLASADSSPCLKYEPDSVELTGRIKRVIFPGPPNYESVRDGDEPEVYWVLFLQKAVSVQGNPKDDLNSATENNVKEIQLIIDVQDYKKHSNLLGKRVTVKGKLMHSFTGHHHTPVLVQVESMTKAPN